EEFLMIKNAPAVLSGELPQTMLGVTAKDSATLEITLSEPSPLFTDRLTSTAAMPCNEKFFTETRARYGLEEGYLKFNGAYRVSHWDNSKYIEMSPNKHYHTRGELPFPEVYLYTNRRTETKTTLDLFNEGKSDIYMATAEELARITVKDTSCMEIKNKVWQLIFSTEYGELGNEEIRRSLVLSLDSSGYRERIPEMYGLASSISPERARPTGLMLPALPGLHRDEAQSLMALGLSELDKKSLKPLSILIPKDAQLNTVAGYLQKQWKDTLGLYVNLEAVATKDFWARLQKGDFSLAILPLEASGQDCSQLLTAFMSTDSRNYGGFASEEYDRRLENAIKASTGEEARE
ncbi:MAG: ABC transporter substrate-binding protein, partial [Angelakisella sp.]